MPLKVYYLDDEVDLLEVFYDAYNSQEIEVKVFNRPQDLIETAEVDPPDLVFIDHRLPGTTGDEVALKLDPAIKKILVTGELNVETHESFIMKLEKPIRRDKVRSLLNSYLSPNCCAKKV